MSVFSRGKNTLSIPMKLHSLNRKRLVNELNQVESLRNKITAVVLQGGEYTTRHCSDHEPLFRQESYFHWTFGVQEPDYYGIILIPTGKSILFAPKLPADYAIWMGKLETKDEIKTRYEVDEVYWTNELSTLLKDEKVETLLTLKGVNSDSGKLSKEATFDGINEFNLDDHTLHPIITELRVIKTEYELEVLRYTNKISSQAHIEVMKNIKPGMYEYQLESIFQHYCYYNGGARIMSYTCICATGQNGATLHYGHAGAPNDRLIKETDMCLFDMGCEYHCYASDITCSFPVSGKFTPEQSIIYNAVLNSSRAVLNSAKPGVEWPRMHELADRIHLEHLKSAGLLIGDIEEMMSSRLGAIFMPHGLGHLMGIDTHDVGGYLAGTPERSTLPGLKSLRTARILHENMVLTVEPGIYFIDCLLEKALNDPILSKFLVKSELDKYRTFGGVRIEDNIVVTSNGIELLTKVPRSISEIEDLMSKNGSQIVTKTNENGNLLK